MHLKGDIRFKHLEFHHISQQLTLLAYVHIFPLFVNTNHSDTGFYSSSSHNKTNLELLKVDKPELQTKIFSSVKLKLGLDMRAHSQHH